MSGAERNPSASWPPGGDGHVRSLSSSSRNAAVKKLSKAQFMKKNKERRLSQAQKSDEAEALRADREFAQDFAKAALRGGKVADEEG